MKPIIKYSGGKSKELDKIIKYVPQFNGTYFEPFFGGGALFFYLEPHLSIINDINAKLMNFYSSIRDDYSNIRKELDEIENLYEENSANFETKIKDCDDRIISENEKLYYDIRDMFNGKKEKKYSDATLYFFINKTAYSGMIRYNSNGEFNVPFGRYKHLNTHLITKEHSDLLNKSTIMNTDFSNVFSMAGKDDFMFLDPPYDCVFSDYGNDGFGKESQYRLAEEYKKIKCKCLMIIGKTPLTESLYNDFVAETYDKNYNVNIKNRFKASAEHLVIKNY